MNMKELFGIREMLCDELSEYAGKQEMGTGELDVIHKLTASIKNIDKIAMFENGGDSRDDGYSREDGYSRGGDYPRRRYSRDSYGGGSSYARRGTHYVRGHYSRDGAKDDMKRQLQEMLDNADDDTIRNAIQRCMDAVEG